MPAGGGLVTGARAIRGLLCVQALVLATYVTLLVVPVDLVSNWSPNSGRRWPPTPTRSSSTTSPHAC